MPRVNIVIAKRGRERHLNACLHFLDKCNTRFLFDVSVYVVEDRFSEHVNPESYFSIKVCYLFLEEQPLLFNKSKLLNYGFEHMRQDYDWVSVVDVDMIYDPRFLDKINSTLIDNTVCVCNGYDIDLGISMFILNGSYVIPDIASLSKYAGNSQMSMTRNTVLLIKEIYGELYCEKFEGWGGEDSDLSFRIYDMVKANLLRRVTFDGMWCHLWHVKERDSETYNNNTQLFRERREYNQKILERWLNGKT